MGIEQILTKINKAKKIPKLGPIVTVVALASGGIRGFYDARKKEFEDERTKNIVTYGPTVASTGLFFGSTTLGAVGAIYGFITGAVPTVIGYGAGFALGKSLNLLDNTTPDW